MVKLSGGSRSRDSRESFSKVRAFENFQKKKTSRERERERERERGGPPMAASSAGGRKKQRRSIGLHENIFGSPSYYDKVELEEGKTFYTHDRSVKGLQCLHDLNVIRRKGGRALHVVDRGSGESILKIPPQTDLRTFVPTKDELQSVINRHHSVKARMGNATRGAKESIPGRGQAIMVCTGDRKAYDNKGIGPFKAANDKIDISAIEDKFREISKYHARFMRMNKVKTGEKALKFGNFYAAAVHTNYWPAIHKDADLTDTICGVCKGSFVRYFILPEYHLAIRIYPGDIWSFKPSILHGMAQAQLDSKDEENPPMGWVLFNNKRTSQQHQNVK